MENPNKNGLTKDFTPKNPTEWLAYAVKGAFVGVGGILPGVSGGVLCVAFGVYKPLMEVLANPFTGLQKHLKMFIPFLLGGGIGFVALAGMIGSLFEQESNLVTASFVGLILGVFPALFREAGQEGRTKASWIAMILSTILTMSMVLFFLVMQHYQGITVTPNTGWYFFSGLLFGCGVIVPGMSSSSPLIFLGLYGPMTAGIGNFDLAVIIPVGLGVVTSVFLLARRVQKLFEKHYSVTFHCIVGFVLASTIPIIPYRFASLTEFALCFVSGAACCAFAYGMDKWGTKIKPAS